MFLFIAKYEWLQLRANKMLLLLGGITVLLLFFALYEGRNRVAFQQETLAQIAQQEKADYATYRAQIANAKPGQHFDGGHFGDPTNPFYFGNRMGAKYAALPPSPLAILSSGQSDVYPYYYKITLSKKQALYHGEELENPQILFNGRFDVSFVIIFLLPLLVIGFTYNVYSSETEAGTLALLAAQNTPVERIVRYRFLFRYLVFNAFFTIALLTGLLLFGTSVQSLAAALPVLGLTWLYTAFWFALSYWINSFKKTSGFSATVLTGAWLAIIFIVPVVISALVDAVHPVPSRLDLITRTRNVSDSVARDKAAMGRFLEEHPEFKPSAAADPKDRNGATLRNRMAVEVLMEKEKARYAAAAEAREATVNRYRFFSPAVFVQQSLNKAAGTGDARYKVFDKEVAAYQQRYRAHFEPLIYRQEKFTAAHLDAVPSFSTALPTAGMDKTSLVDAAFLFALTVAFLFLAWRKERRVAPQRTSSATKAQSVSGVETFHAKTPRGKVAKAFAAEEKKVE